MKAVRADIEVYVWLGRTDMRAGFERLAAMVQQNLKRSVISGGMYVFISSSKKRVKILYWDNDGYALWYKRLEAGSFRIEEKEGVEQITGVDLLELLSGLDLARIKVKKNAEKGLYNAL